MLVGVTVGVEVGVMVGVVVALGQFPIQPGIEALYPPFRANAFHANSIALIVFHWGKDIFDRSQIIPGYDYRSLFLVIIYLFYPTVRPQFYS